MRRRKIQVFFGFYEYLLRTRDVNLALKWRKKGQKWVVNANKHKRWPGTRHIQLSRTIGCLPPCARLSAQIRPARISPAQQRNDLYNLFFFSSTPFFFCFFFFFSKSVSFSNRWNPSPNIRDYFSPGPQLPCCFSDAPA